jgi:hypothetical protein
LLHLDDHSTNYYYFFWALLLLIFEKMGNNNYYYNYNFWALLWSRDLCERLQKMEGN